MSLRKNLVICSFTAGIRVAPPTISILLMSSRCKSGKQNVSKIMTVFIKKGNSRLWKVLFKKMNFLIYSKQGRRKKINLEKSKI